jgi:hypothetical protein
MVCLRHRRCHHLRHAIVLMMVGGSDFRRQAAKETMMDVVKLRQYETLSPFEIRTSSPRRRARCERVGGRT